MTFLSSAILLRNFVRPEVHYSFAQATVEMNHSPDIVVPELLPAIEVRVVNIETLSLITDVAGAGPVFLDDAIPKD
jgi:hypothetical protein